MKKILIVEDDSAIADIYQTMLKAAGFEAESMNQGQQVIDAFKHIASGEYVKPDIILLDLILPDMNGVQVLRAIRNMPEAKDVAVFILTNQSKTEMDGLDEVKPDKYIIKANVTPTQLVDMIKGQLK